MTSRSRRRRFATLIAFVIVSSACSGEIPKDPQTVGLTPAGSDETTPPPSETTGPGESPSAAPRRHRRPRPVPDGDDPRRRPDRQPAPAAGQAVHRRPRTASESRTRQITMCGHAALTYAAAFDTRPEDLNVYWEVVKEPAGSTGASVT